MKENLSFLGRGRKLAGLFFCALALAAAAGCARGPAASAPAASVPAAASAPEFVTLPELTDEELFYMKFGESFQDYYEIEGQSVTFGTKGLYYTVNGVQVFDTVYDAGLEPSEYTNPYTEGWEEYFQNNSFLLVDVTAEYKEAEAVSPEAIPVSMPFLRTIFPKTTDTRPLPPMQRISTPSSSISVSTPAPASR